MIATQPSHVLPMDDVTAWLAEHGVAVDDVVTASIRLDREARGERIAAWLDVTYYLLDEHGRRFWDRASEPARAATAVATVPLTRFPHLVPL